MIAVSGFKIQSLEGYIKDRLEKLYPNRSKNYFHWFGGKLKFWYFRKKIKDGSIADGELLNYYEKLFLPTIIAHFTWVTTLLIILFLIFFK